MKQRWSAGRVISPQRDMFAQLVGGVVELPGIERRETRYFRDVYDHLIRLSDLSTATATCSAASSTSISRQSLTAATRSSSS